MPDHPMKAAYVHRYRVRYIDCDMQRVVYNSHYLTFCDDAVEAWMRDLGFSPGAEAWDFMLKKAEITWSGSATLGDEIWVGVAVARWGRTSFALAYEGSIDGERPVFTAEITYVGVRPGTTETVETPAPVRSLLGEPVG